MAWGWSPPRGAHGTCVPAARARARDAPPRAQVHARAGHTRRDAQCQEAQHDTDEGAPPKPDLVARDFISSVPTYKLVGDITYLRTGQGWLFLATVIDLDTRMVVGWAMSECMTADIVVSALELARRRGYVAEGTIFHSDRNSQHTSGPLRRGPGKGREARLRRTGSCHGNAAAGPLFATLRSEMYCRRPSPRARRRGSP